MRYIYLLLISLFYFNAQGQILSPVKWTITSEHLGGEEHNLIFKAKMDAPWTVYSQWTSDEGPFPTTITYESEGFETLGKSVETGHKKEGFDKMFDVDVIKFLPDQPFTITQKVKAPSGTEVTGYLTFMTCNEEMCLPPSDVEFALMLKGGTAAVKSKDKTATMAEKAPAEKVQTMAKQAVTAAGTNVTIKEVGQADSKFKLSTPQVKPMDAQPAATTSQTATTGQDLLTPVKWDVQMQKKSADTYELTYTAIIDKGWKVYSQFTSDDGPYPTLITYETEGAEQKGKGTETGARKEGYDKLFETDVIAFYPDQPFVIKHQVKTTAPKLKGYLTYMTCDKEKCLPPSDVEFAFSTQTGARVPYDMAAAAPAAAAAMGSAAANVLGANISGDIIDNRIPQLSASYQNPLGTCEGGGTEESSSLWATFFFGFIGGLIALLTPCVFPMIPLTVSFFTKDTKRKGWVNGLIYALSIIVIYVALGMGLTLLFGEEALNRLSVNWIANTLFFLIFLVFAFSFFGYYEIRLPSSWSTKSDTMVDKGGLLGIFFMAFTLALVSFSCTGPIIGTAIVQAASTGSKMGPAIVMGGFALGLALPFGIFAAIPALLNNLPKSGGWMNSVKVTLGFLELALAFKFLSVADMTNGWGFLRYELFMAIWVLCFAGLSAYLFGLIKFPHDSPVKKLSPIRLLLAIASLGFTIYLATGFMINKDTNSYASKAAMSGLAPPASYNFFLSKGDVDKTIKEQFPSYTVCANNIPCFKDYYEGKAYAKSVGKPVFLDFTGHGCVNCRKTEEHIWIDDEIRRKLKEDWVLVSLYVDEDKKLDKVYVSKERKNKIRNVGNMWADFQILNFDQNSQPLYVMMTPDEKVLAKPRGYVQNEGIKEYTAYMDCGMATYDKAK